MDHMGIRSAMDGVFDLKMMDWVGKPHDSAYEKMERWLGEKSQIVLLEDSLRNLEPAHRRGWTTVFVSPSAEIPDWVDYHIPHILDLIRILE